MQSSTNQLTPWSTILLDKLIVQYVSQEIPWLLWNPKAHCRVHKSPPPVPILSQMNQIQTYFPKIHFSIIFPSEPRPIEWTLSFGLPNQNFVRIAQLPMHATCPAHLVLLDLIILIISGGVQIMELLIMQFSTASCRFNLDDKWR
jgi:hypothetical protein